MPATAVKERGILFKAEMVRAILAGRKTQTRRLVKPPVPIRNPCDLRWMDHALHPEVYGAGGAWLTLKCPFGIPGDRLWVRETWTEFEVDDVQGTRIYYKADNPDPVFNARWRVSRWSSPIHMPRWASRITLEITDLRVQRLHEITEADARAEGVSRPDGKQPPFDGTGLSNYQPYRQLFRDLWKSINGPESWDANPWVWALTFKRV